MNKEDKIKILKNALDIYKECRAGGLCICIAYAICDHLGEDRKATEIKDYIPEFNRDNLKKLAKEHKFKKPENLHFWWEFGEPKNRIRAIGALVKQIKEQDDTREK